MNETNIRVRPDEIARQIAENGGKGLVGRIGIGRYQNPHTLEDYPGKQVPIPKAQVYLSRDGAGGQAEQAPGVDVGREPRVVDQDARAAQHVRDQVALDEVHVPDGVEQAGSRGSDHLVEVGRHDGGERSTLHE